MTAEGLKTRKFKDETAVEVHSTYINIEETCDNARCEVIEMIRNYEPNNCKPTNIEMRIIVMDEKAIFFNPRRLPIKEGYIVHDQWLKEEEIIEPSESEFYGLLLLENKNDSTLRLCTDFRRVNRVIVKGRYPPPLIEGQLDLLQKA